MTKSELIAAVSAFLKKQTTLTIATVDREAWPQAADVFYVNDDALNLYFVSGQKSRHALNLVRVSRVAVTVHNATWDWRDIQGVQIEGEARAITDPDERDLAWGLFRGKFPFVAEFTDQIVRSSFYVVTPRWVRLIDNTREIDYREEFKLP
jgi:uncharacterized protein YhbP (UPF0306 family)